MTKEKARDGIAYILGFKPVKTAGQRVLVIVTHIVLWGLFLALPLLIYRIRILDITFFYRELVDKSFLIILFYVNYYFLLPRLFQRGRIAKYFLSIAGALVLLCALQLTVEYFFRAHLRGKARHFILANNMPVEGHRFSDSLMGPGPRMVTFGTTYGPQLSVAGSLQLRDSLMEEGNVEFREVIREEEGRFPRWTKGAHLRRLNAKDSLIGVAYAETTPAFPLGGPFGQKGHFLWIGFPMVLMNAFSSAIIILLLGGFI